MGISETPPKSHETKPLDDNARKFISPTLDPDMLAEGEVTSFRLIIDRLVTSVSSETKLAHKEFADGTVQVLLITKKTVDSKRTTEKRPLGDDDYQRLLAESVRHLEKTRHGFAFRQGDVTFDLKYDEFDGLTMLEVDADSDEQREAFDPGDFPGELQEVTGGVRYYGFRVCDVLS